MRLTLPRKTLHEALGNVSRAIVGKTTLPILSFFRFEASPEGTLTITGSNLEIWLRQTIKCDVEPGLADDALAFTLPARPFTELVSRLPEADVVLTREDGSSKIKLTCRQTKTDFATLPAEEYPAKEIGTTPADATVFLPASKLAQALSLTLFAVSTETTRANMLGPLFRVSERFQIVATDSHRLAVADIEAATVEGMGEGIVPPLAANELLRLAGSVKADTVLSEIQLSLRAADGLLIAKLPNGIQITTRLIEEKFPNWERLLPVTDKSANAVLYRRDELLSAVQRGAIYAADNANRLTFATAAETMTLVAENDRLGRFEEDVECVVTGEAFTTAFNAGYLRALLSALSAQGIRFQQSEPLRPALCTPSGEGIPEGIAYRHLLMPMQVV